MPRSGYGATPPAIPMPLDTLIFDPSPCGFPKPRAPLLPVGLDGIGPGSALLAPAYHCRTMLDPALALGGEVMLYPLAPDLAPDLAAIAALADRSPVPVKALLTAHDYRLHLLHLPCHPSLDDHELDWMIATVRKVGAGGTASRD